jgi:hypothetical protein
MTKKMGLTALVLCVLAGAGYLTAKWVVTRQVARQIQKTVAEMPEVKAVEYGGLDVALFHQNVSLRDVTVTLAVPDQQLHIDRLAVDGFKAGDTIPGRLHLVMEGLDLDVADPLMEPFRRDLEDLGYRRLKVFIECRYRYDETARKLDIQRFRLDVARMGNIELAAAMENLDVSRLKGGLQNPLSLVMLLPSAAISSVHLNYRDDSLVGRLLQNGARRSGVSVRDYTRRITGDFSRLVGNTQDPRLRETVAAVSRFLEKPEALSVRLSPQKPVPLLQLVFSRDPAALAALLGLQVST